MSPPHPLLITKTELEIDTWLLLGQLIIFLLDSQPPQSPFSYWVKRSMRPGGAGLQRHESEQMSRGGSFVPAETTITTGVWVPGGSPQVERLKYWLNVLRNRLLCFSKDPSFLQLTWLGSVIMTADIWVDPCFHWTDNISFWGKYPMPQMH